MPHIMVNGLVLLPPSPFTYAFIIQHGTSRPEPLTAYMWILYFQPQQSVLSIPSCNNVVKENLALPVTQRLRFYRLWLVSTPLWCHWTTENLNFQFNQIILHQRQIIIIILSKTKTKTCGYSGDGDTVLHHSLLLFIHWFNMDNDYRRMDDFHLCCILFFFAF